MPDTLRQEKSLTAHNDFFDARPDYSEGYQEESNTVIRLVKPKKKNQKPYKVTGIEDVASQNNWKGWLYLAPVIVLLVIFLLYPLINTIAISFRKDYNQIDGTNKGFTWENFGAIFGRKLENGGQEVNFSRYAIPNTFIIVLVTVPLATLIALLISVGLNALPFFKKFLQTVFFLPYVTNSIAIGMVFAAMFNVIGNIVGSVTSEASLITSVGIVNNVIEFFGGTPISWINSGSKYGANIAVMVIYIVWNALPFKILILLGGLQSVNKQYYDAARVDGTSRVRIFSRITVPLLSPMIAYVVITGFIGGFKEYTSIVGIFGEKLGPVHDPGRLNTMVGYIYESLERSKQGQASAAALILFGIILVVTLINLYVSKKKVHY